MWLVVARLVRMSLFCFLRRPQLKPALRRSTPVSRPALPRGVSHPNMHLANERRAEVEFEIASSFDEADADPFLTDHVPLPPNLDLNTLVSVRRHPSRDKVASAEVLSSRPLPPPRRRGFVLMECADEVQET